MPSVPQNPSARFSRQARPADPNHPNDAQCSTPSVSHQPSPAIISSSSHVGLHVLRRRFVGPMPENVANSEEVEAKRQRFKKLREKAFKRVLREEQGDRDGDERLFRGMGESDSGFGSGDLDGSGVKRVMRRIRIRRRGADGRDVEEEFEFQADSDSDSDGDGTHEGHRNHRAKLNRERSKKGKDVQRRKNVWVGESFDIGREFVSATSSGLDVRPSTFPNDRDTTGGSSRSVRNRPSTSRHTTQDTFVTARTDFSSARSSQSEQKEGPRYGNDLTRTTSTNSTNDDPDRGQERSVRIHTRSSQGSSMRPLISKAPNRHEDGEDGSGLGGGGSNSFKTSGGIRNRLKSAIRRPTASSGPGSISAMTSPPHLDVGKSNRVGLTAVATRDERGKSKSVQFPMDPVTRRHSERGTRPGLGADKGVLKGNKAPASPTDVLSREGEDVAGTSAGAVEEAMEELEGEEDEQENPMAGSVVMRDRMLVRVGHHAESNTGAFDEAYQRRSPCKRMEPMEEYIVVWRKQQVEFYQDWSYRIQERVHGCKRLCFIVPLIPARTSLTVFNHTDMSLSLTTSAGKLQDDVEHILNSNSSAKSKTVRDRVAQSRQAHWLRRGHRGTHVFIMKVAERSRALDWYWELWRELGGQLPQRLDITVPALSTSVRLIIPQDSEQMGIGKTLRILSAGAVVETCWDMLEGVLGEEAMKRQKELGMTAALAWRSAEGRLDWIAHDTTVQGRSRRWAVIAGVARQTPQHYQELQLRQAHHQPASLRLEDGSKLAEPPALEGFLTRHNPSNSVEDVYVATHDGNIFVSTVKNAIPPIPPTLAGSTPSDVFQELHKEHIDNEKKRMSDFIEKSAGYVDLRDIDTVGLERESAVPASVPDKKDDAKSRSFVVKMSTGETFRFEARRKEDAKEWVEGLRKLIEYWRRKQRVDARLRMDATELQNQADPFAAAGSNETLADIWDWCTLRGCRSVTYAGRVHIKSSKFDKYRLRYVVLTGGMLITFKIKKNQTFHQRKKRFSLFGSFVYSGMMAHDELHGQTDRDAMAGHHRVYQDGLQSSDGSEDTTLVVRLATSASWSKQARHLWEGKVDVPLSKKAQAMLFVRARSALERDRWVWALNAEKERMTRSHLEAEEARRNLGVIP